MTRVLLCVATRIEALACQRAVSGSSNDQVRFEVIQTGMGLEAASQGLIARLNRKETSPTLVVSTGFAGSVSPGFTLGQWVLATEVRSHGTPGESLSPHLEKTLKRTALNWKAGVYLSTHEVIARGAHRLWSELADIVDMESFALFEVCFRQGIAFQALRMVTDTSEHPIPNAIGHWSRGPDPRAICRGVRSAAEDPIGLARFVLRGAFFSSQLTEGWRELSVNWRV